VGNIIADVVSLAGLEV